MDPRYSPILRTLSAVLIVAFVSQDLSWAQELAAPLSSVFIPKADGLVVRSYRPDTGGDERLIVNIQDAHASLGAQYGISRVIETLVKNYGIDLLGVEAADGEVDTSVVSSYPDAAVRKEVAEALLKDTRISGTEYFKIVSSAPVEIYGLEDLDLYQKNVASFQRLLQNRDRARQEMLKVRETVDGLSARIFPREIHGLQKREFDYQNDRLSFSEYWQVIEGLLRVKGLDVAEFLNVSTMSEALLLEKRIDFKKAEREREDLISFLREKLQGGGFEKVVQKALEFKLAKISPAEFHRYLADLSRTHGKDPSGYPELFSYSKYLSLFESVEMVALTKELQRVTDRIKEVYLTSDEQKEMDRLGRATHVWALLLEGALTPEDEAFYRGNRELFSADALRVALDALRKRNGIGQDKDIDFGTLQEQLLAAEAFYEGVLARNDVMVRNLLQRMKEKGQRVAALVSGGFHSGGFSELMEQGRISHVVIMPKFDSKEGERPYVTVITQKGSYLDLEMRRRAQEESILMVIGAAVLKGEKFETAKETYLSSYRKADPASSIPAEPEFPAASHSASAGGSAIPETEDATKYRALGTWTTMGAMARDRVLQYAGALQDGGRCGAGCTRIAAPDRTVAVRIHARTHAMSVETMSPLVRPVADEPAFSFDFGEHNLDEVLEAVGARLSARHVPAGRLSAEFYIELRRKGVDEGRLSGPDREKVRTFLDSLTASEKRAGARMAAREDFSEFDTYVLDSDGVWINDHFATPWVQHDGGHLTLAAVESSPDGKPAPDAEGYYRISSPVVRYFTDGTFGRKPLFDPASVSARAEEEAVMEHFADMVRMRGQRLPDAEGQAKSEMSARGTLAKTDHTYAQLAAAVQLFSEFSARLRSGESIKFKRLRSADEFSDQVFMARPEERFIIIDKFPAPSVRFEILAAPAVKKNGGDDRIRLRVIDRKNGLTKDIVVIPEKGFAAEGLRIQWSEPKGGQPSIRITASWGDRALVIVPPGGKPSLPVVFSVPSVKYTPKKPMLRQVFIAAVKGKKLTIHRPGAAGRFTAEFGSEGDKNGIPLKFIKSGSDTKTGYRTVAAGPENDVVVISNIGSFTGELPFVRFRFEDGLREGRAGVYLTLPDGYEVLTSEDEEATSRHQPGRTVRETVGSRLAAMTRASFIEQILAAFIYPTRVPGAEEADSDAQRARFLDYLQVASDDLAALRDPSAASFQAFFDALQMHPSRFAELEYGPIEGMPIQTELLESTQGLGLRVKIDIEQISRLMELARGQEFFRHVLNGLVVFNGAKIKDFQADPEHAFHHAYWTMERSFSHSDGTLDPGPWVDFIKKFAAHTAELEAVGWAALYRYLSYSGHFVSLDKGEISVRITQAANARIGAFLSGLHGWVRSFETSDTRDIALRMRILEQNRRAESLDLLMDLHEVGLQEGWLDTHELEPRPEGLRFLLEDRYMGRRAGESLLPAVNRRLTVPTSLTGDVSSDGARLSAGPEDWTLETVRKTKWLGDLNHFYWVGRKLTAEIDQKKSWLTKPIRLNRELSFRRNGNAAELKRSNWKNVGAILDQLEDGTYAYMIVTDTDQEAGIVRFHLVFGTKSALKKFNPKEKTGLSLTFPLQFRRDVAEGAKSVLFMTTFTVRLAERTVVLDRIALGRSLRGKGLSRDLFMNRALFLQEKFEGSGFRLLAEIENPIAEKYLKEFFPNARPVKEPENPAPSSTNPIVYESAFGYSAEQMLQAVQERRVSGEELAAWIDDPEKFLWDPSVTPPVTLDRDLSAAMDIIVAAIMMGDSWIRIPQERLEVWFGYLNKGMFTLGGLDKRRRPHLARQIANAVVHNGGPGLVDSKVFQEMKEVAASFGARLAVLETMEEIRASIEELSGTEEDLFRELRTIRASLYHFIDKAHDERRQKAVEEDLQQEALLLTTQYILRNQHELIQQAETLVEKKSSQELGVSIPRVQALLHEAATQAEEGVREIEEIDLPAVTPRSIVREVLIQLERTRGLAEGRAWADVLRKGLVNLEMLGDSRSGWGESTAKGLLVQARTHITSVKDSLKDPKPDWSAKLEKVLGLLESRTSGARLSTVDRRLLFFLEKAREAGHRVRLYQDYSNYFEGQVTVATNETVKVQSNPNTVHLEIGFYKIKKAENLSTGESLSDLDRYDYKEELTYSNIAVSTLGTLISFVGTLALWLGTADYPFFAPVIFGVLMASPFLIFSLIQHLEDGKKMPSEVKIQYPILAFGLLTFFAHPFFSLVVFSAALWRFNKLGKKYYDEARLKRDEHLKSHFGRSNKRANALEVLDPSFHLSAGGVALNWSTLYDEKTGRFRPGAKQLLETLHEAHITAWVLTDHIDAKEVIRVLEKAGITVAYSDDHDEYKGEIVAGVRGGIGEDVKAKQLWFLKMNVKESGIELRIGDENSHLVMISSRPEDIRAANKAAVPSIALVPTSTDKANIISLKPTALFNGFLGFTEIDEFVDYLQSKGAYSSGARLADRSDWLTIPSSEMTKILTLQQGALLLSELLRSGEKIGLRIYDRGRKDAAKTVRIKKIKDSIHVIEADERKLKYPMDIKTFILEGHDQATRVASYIEVSMTGIISIVYAREEPVAPFMTAEEVIEDAERHAGARLAADRVRPFSLATLGTALALFVAFFVWIPPSSYAQQPAQPLQSMGVMTDPAVILDAAGVQQRVEWVAGEDDRQAAQGFVGLAKGGPDGAGVYNRAVERAAEDLLANYQFDIRRNPDLAAGADIQLQSSFPLVSSPSIRFSIGWILEHFLNAREESRRHNNEENPAKLAAALYYLESIASNRGVDRRRVARGVRRMLAFPEPYVQAAAASAAGAYGSTDPGFYSMQGGTELGEHDIFETLAAIAQNAEADPVAQNYAIEAIAAPETSRRDRRTDAAILGALRASDNLFAFSAATRAAAKYHIAGSAPLVAGNLSLETGQTYAGIQAQLFLRQSIRTSASAIPGMAQELEARMRGLSLSGGSSTSRQYLEYAGLLQQVDPVAYSRVLGSVTTGGDVSPTRDPVILMGRLESPTFPTQVRMDAARILGEIGYAPAEPELLALFRDDAQNARLRETSLSAIFQMASVLSLTPDLAAEMGAEVREIVGTPRGNTGLKTLIVRNWEKLMRLGVDYASIVSSVGSVDDPTLVSLIGIIAEMNGDSVTGVPFLLDALAAVEFNPLTATPGQENAMNAYLRFVGTPLFSIVLSSSAAKAEVLAQVNARILLLGRSAEGPSDAHRLDMFRRLKSRVEAQTPRGARLAAFRNFMVVAALSLAPLSGPALAQQADPEAAAAAGGFADDATSSARGLHSPDSNVRVGAAMAMNPEAARVQIQAFVADVSTRTEPAYFVAGLEDSARREGSGGAQFELRALMQGSLTSRFANNTDARFRLEVIQGLKNWPDAGTADFASWVIARLADRELREASPNKNVLLAALGSFSLLTVPGDGAQPWFSEVVTLLGIFQAIERSNGGVMDDSWAEDISAMRSTEVHAYFVDIRRHPQLLSFVSTLLLQQYRDRHVSWQLDAFASRANIRQLFNHIGRQVPRFSGSLVSEVAIPSGWHLLSLDSGDFRNALRRAFGLERFRGIQDARRHPDFGAIAGRFERYDFYPLSIGIRQNTREERLLAVRVAGNIILSPRNEPLAGGYTSSLFWALNQAARTEMDMVVLAEIMNVLGLLTTEEGVLDPRVDTIDFRRQYLMTEDSAAAAAAYALGPSRDPRAPQALIPFMRSNSSLVQAGSIMAVDTLAHVRTRPELIEPLTGIMKRRLSQRHSGFLEEWGAVDRGDEWYMAQNVLLYMIRQSARDQSLRDGLSDKFREGFRNGTPDEVLDIYLPLLEAMGEADWYWLSYDVLSKRFSRYQFFLWLLIAAGVMSLGVGLIRRIFPDDSGGGDTKSWEAELDADIYGELGEDRPSRDSGARLAASGAPWKGFGEAVNYQILKRYVQVILILTAAVAWTSNAAAQTIHAITGGPGQTISEIAQENHLTEAEIIQANLTPRDGYTSFAPGAPSYHYPESNSPDLIFAGTNLIIPVATQSPVATVISPAGAERGSTTRLPTTDVQSRIGQGVITPDNDNPFHEPLPYPGREAFFSSNGDGGVLLASADRPIRLVNHPQGDIDLSAYVNNAGDTGNHGTHSLVNLPPSYVGILLAVFAVLGAVALIAWPFILWRRDSRKAKKTAPGREESSPRAVPAAVSRHAVPPAIVRLDTSKEEPGWGINERIEHRLNQWSGLLEGDPDKPRALYERDIASLVNRLWTLYYQTPFSMELFEETGKDQGSSRELLKQVQWIRLRMLRAHRNLREEYRHVKSLKSTSDEMRLRAEALEAHLRDVDLLARYYTDYTHILQRVLDSFLFAGYRKLSPFSSEFWGFKQLRLDVGKSLFSLLRGITRIEHELTNAPVPSNVDIHLKIRDYFKSLIIAGNEDTRAVGPVWEQRRANTRNATMMSALILTITRSMEALAMGAVNGWWAVTLAIAVAFIGYPIGESWRAIRAVKRDTERFRKEIEGLNLVIRRLSEQSGLPKLRGAQFRRLVFERNLRNMSDKGLMARRKGTLDFLFFAVGSDPAQIEKVERLVNSNNLIRSGELFYVILPDSIAGVDGSIIPLISAYEKLDSGLSFQELIRGLMNNPNVRRLNPHLASFLDDKGKALYKLDLRAHEGALVRSEFILQDATAFHGRLDKTVAELRGGVIYAGGTGEQTQFLEKALKIPSIEKLEIFEGMRGPITRLHLVIAQAYAVSYEAFRTGRGEMGGMGWVSNYHSSRLLFGDTRIEEDAEFQLSGGFASIDQVEAQQLGVIVTTDRGELAYKTYIGGAEREILDLYDLGVRNANPYLPFDADLLSKTEEVRLSPEQRRVARLPVLGYWGGQVRKPLHDLVMGFRDLILKENREDDVRASENRPRVLDEIGRITGLQLDRLFLVSLVAVSQQDKENFLTNYTALAQAVLAKMPPDSPFRTKRRVLRFFQRFGELVLRYSDDAERFQKIHVDASTPVTAFVSKDVLAFGLNEVLAERGIPTDAPAGARLAATPSLLIGIPSSERKVFEIKQVLDDVERAAGDDQKTGIRVLLIDPIPDVVLALPGFLRGRGFTVGQLSSDGRDIEDVLREAAGPNKPFVILDAAGLEARKMIARALSGADVAQFTARLAGQISTALPKGRVEEVLIPGASNESLAEFVSELPEKARISILKSLPATTPVDIEIVHALKPLFQKGLLETEDISLEGVFAPAKDTRDMKMGVVTEEMVAGAAVPLWAQRRIIEGQIGKIRLFLIDPDGEAKKRLIEKGLIAEEGDIDDVIRVSAVGGKFQASAINDAVKAKLHIDHLRDGTYIGGHNQAQNDLLEGDPDKPLTALVNFRGYDHTKLFLVDMFRLGRMGEHENVDLLPFDWSEIQDAFETERSVTESA